MNEEILKRISETPVVPSTRLKPESLVEHWAAHKRPTVSVVDGVASLGESTEAVVIRAKYTDDQGRRCSRYIAEVFIYDGDEKAALSLAEKWAAAHNYTLDKCFGLP